MELLKINIRKSLSIVTILIAAGILLSLFITFALLQFSRSKSDLISMLEEEGFVLLDALTASGQQSFLAYEEFDGLMQFRLMNNALWIEETDYTRGVDRNLLDSYVERMDLFRIFVLNQKGEQVAGSTPPYQESNQSAKIIKDSQVREFLSGSSTDSLILGFREGQYAGEPRFAVVLRRRKGGAIVVVAKADRLLSFRKKLGPGRLIQDISTQPGIEYIVLQDSIGIVLASPNVFEMSRIESDPFLDNIYHSNKRGSRFQMFPDQEVFEIAGGFTIENESFGIFRIGLNTAHYQNILQNTRIRLFAIVTLFVLGGIVGLSLLVARQNAKLLSQSYQKVKTHTGEILQNMEDAVVVIDSSGVITVFNEAASRLFLIAKEKASGRKVDSLGIASLAVLTDSLETGRPIDRPQEKVTIRNKKRIFSLRTSILKSENGEIENVILVATDFTVQRSLEEELRRQEKLSAMGKLASGVAHEIRNPINAIGMIAQRFLKEFKPIADEEEYKELASTIVKETRRSDRIIRRFLDFARPPELNISAVPIKELLQETVSILGSIANAKGIHIKLESIQPANLQIDRDQIKQVFINLVQNSIDATEKGGRITLMGEKLNSEYLIKVSDTGKGISEVEINKIFDLYFSTKKDGLGMGLPIVYQVIQRHNGSIHVESKTGKGTEFIITLPLKK